jgi:hypothetical protein
MTHRVPPFIEDLLAKTIAPADTEELLARFNADVWANEAYNRWIIHPDHGTVSLEFFKWLVAYEAGSQNSRNDGSSLKNPSQPVGGEGSTRILLQLALDEMQNVIEAVNHNDGTRHLKYSTPYGAMTGMVSVREGILEQCAAWGIEVSPHRSPSPSPRRWRPIDEAPRDGTPFLAMCGGYAAVMCWWDRRFEYANGHTRYWPRPGEVPTHWQPLPEPPTP